jgi:hypothetical protein
MVRSHETQSTPAAVLIAGIPDDRILPGAAAHALKDLLGAAAWSRLPAAVQARFSGRAEAVDYKGEFAVIRASKLGFLIASLCRLIGTPIAPYVGTHVSSVVRVRATDRGVEWRREYHWPRRTPSIVVSTKVIEPNGALSRNYRRPCACPSGSTRRRAPFTS